MFLEVRGNGSPVLKGVKVHTVSAYWVVTTSRVEQEDSLGGRLRLRRKSSCRWFTCPADFWVGAEAVTGAAGASIHKHSRDL